MKEKLAKYMTYSIPLNSITVFLFLLLQTLPKCQGQIEDVAESDLLTMISPGAYFEEFDVDLYDKVVPILFKFKKPEWVDQRKLNLKSECTSGDDWGSGSLCPIFFYLHNELSILLKSTMTLQPLTLPETQMEVAFDCDSLSRHFLTERLSDNDFKNYLINLKKCAAKKCYESETISEYSGKIQTVYETMEKKFMDQYYGSLPENGRVNKAAEANEKLALSGLLYAHYLALIQKWNRGFRDCKAGFVPDSLISEIRLREALESLERLVKSPVLESGPTSNYTVTYKFTLPYASTQISRYYKAPLADCVYSGDKFYVRILVPITKVRKMSPNIVLIRSLPFFRVDEESTPQLCRISGFETGRYFHTGIEDFNGKLTSLSAETPCDPTNFKLCQIPEPYESMVDPETVCARQLILYDNDPSEGNKAAVTENCPMSCVPMRNERLPILVRAQDKFDSLYILSDPDKAESGINLECVKYPSNDTNNNANPEGEDEPEKITKRLPSLNKGALGLVIGCNCKLPLPRYEIRPGSECLQDNLIFKIMPFHFMGEADNNEESDKKGAKTSIVDDDDKV